MKKLLFILLFFVCFVSFGQDEKLGGILPMKDKKVTYTNVVQVDSSVTAKELYMRAKIFMAEAYKSAKDVLQVDDKEAAQIVGKGIVKVQWQTTFYSETTTNLYHRIAIQCKDGRYKYEITAFTVNYMYGGDKYVALTEANIPLEDFGHNREKNAKKYYTNVDIELSRIISSLEKAMQKPSKSNDW